VRSGLICPEASRAEEPAGSIGPEDPVCATELRSFIPWHVAAGHQIASTQIAKEGADGPREWEILHFKYGATCAWTHPVPEKIVSRWDRLRGRHTRQSALKGVRMEHCNACPIPGLQVAFRSAKGCLARWPPSRQANGVPSGLLPVATLGAMARTGRSRKLRVWKRLAIDRWACA
jgi:hypothetical protein